MHLCAALPGRLLDLFIKREVGECTDGQYHEVHAPAQHRNGPLRAPLPPKRFPRCTRLKCQQSIHVRAGRTTHACRRLLCRSEGAAGDTHQLSLPAGPSSTHRPRYCRGNHSPRCQISFSCFRFSFFPPGWRIFLFQYTMPCAEKQNPAFFIVFLSFTHDRAAFHRFACLLPEVL